MRRHSYPIDQDFKAKAMPLAEVLCRRPVAVGSQPERVDAEMVSGNLFTMLGIHPRQQLPHNHRRRFASRLRWSRSRALTAAPSALSGLAWALRRAELRQDETSRTPKQALC